MFRFQHKGAWQWRAVRAWTQTGCSLFQIIVRQTAVCTHGQGEETVFLRCCLLGHLLREAHYCGDGGRTHSKFYLALYHSIWSDLGMWLLTRSVTHGIVRMNFMATKWMKGYGWDLNTVFVFSTSLMSLPSLHSHIMCDFPYTVLTLFPFQCPRMALHRP